MLVGTFVETVQEVVAVTRANILGSGERRQEAGGVVAGEDLVKVEAQQATIRPLGAVDQDELPSVE